MSWLTIGILGYLVFGLLLMTYMCPCWHPFEWLIGAVIWPIAAVIGIVVSLRESRSTPIIDNWWVYQYAMSVILAEEIAKQAATKLVEEAGIKEKLNAQEVPQAQAPMDQATHDEHRGVGQSMPC